MSPDEKARIDRDRRLREREARTGRVVHDLTKMGRGVDEILAHLFIRPMTLPQLHAAMVQERTTTREEFTRRYIERAPDPYDSDIPMEYRVDHTILYDVGQLATASILETDGTGELQISDRDGVRVFLRAAFYRGQHEPGWGFRNELNSRLHQEGATA